MRNKFFISSYIRTTRMISLKSLKKFLAPKSFTNISDNLIFETFRNSISESSKKELNEKINIFRSYFDDFESNIDPTRMYQYEN